MEILSLLFYAEQFLKIVTKQARLEWLVFNTYQKELARIAEEEIAKGKPVRILVLKCRQIGGSTWGAAFNFHQVVTNPFRNGLVIAHDEDSTSKLFTMCKRFYDFLPAKMRPMKRFSNKKELKFENPNEEERGRNPGLMSGLEVETANNLNAGRGSPIHNLHISELAFWKNASTVLTGLFQSVPYEPGTSIIIESTANGISGDGQEFYERCMSALNGQSDFRFVFFKWTHNPEYETDPGKDFERTEYEKELCAIHPELTDRKLAWRRYKIRNEMGKTRVAPEDQFRQEYPLTPEEAFISSGRPVFDIAKLMTDIERAKNIPFKRGFISTDGKFIEDEKGPYKLFSGPGDARAAIGGDVAEGVEGGDSSAMTIVSKNLDQLAAYHESLHPDLFGAQMVTAGKFFNNALLANEVNNHGHTTLNNIVGQNYPNIYMRQVLDERTKEFTEKAGWETNVKTKYIMLDEFVAAYRDNLLNIKCIETLREMSTLVFDAAGKVELTGKDRVVSWCIAIQAAKQIPSLNSGSFDSSERKPKFKSLIEMVKHSESREESYFD